ncbi:MAG: hypothetical protein P1P64_07445 [Treponemataceae bacterium]
MYLHLKDNATKIIEIYSKLNTVLAGIEDSSELFFNTKVKPTAKLKVKFTHTNNNIYILTFILQNNSVYRFNESDKAIKEGEITLPSNFIYLFKETIEGIENLKNSNPEYKAEVIEGDLDEFIEKAKANV